METFFPCKPLFLCYRPFHLLLLLIRSPTANHENYNRVKLPIPEWLLAGAGRPALLPGTWPVWFQQILARGIIVLVSPRTYNGFNNHLE